MCILSIVVFVDQRREVRWEWQCLLAAAVRLGTEPTHTAATCSTRGTIPPLAMRSWLRGAHPAPEQRDWIVEGHDHQGYEIWFCNLCKKAVSTENGHLTGAKHTKAVENAEWQRQTAVPTYTQVRPGSLASGSGPPAPASNRSPAPTSQTPGADTAGSASASALPMVVDASAAGDTIFIELPVDVALALQRALDRALPSRVDVEDRR